MYTLNSTWNTTNKHFFFFIFSSKSITLFFTFTILECHMAHFKQLLRRLHNLQCYWVLKKYPSIVLFNYLFGLTFHVDLCHFICWYRNNVISFGVYFWRPQYGYNYIIKFFAFVWNKFTYNVTRIQGHLSRDATPHEWISHNGWNTGNPTFENWPHI